ncbi:MAG: AAA family ATPase [Opitutales bacterium]|nr:AAA family ATPase [Opitutales bacterium]
MGKDEFKGIIKSIEIIQFRKMKDISFKLAPHVTVIAGQNATMKTTLLGMLGQPFSFHAKTIKEGEEDTNPPIVKEKTLIGYAFEGKFSDKFRLSKEFDHVGEHRWKLNFVSDDIYTDGHIEMESIARKEKGKESGIRFWNAAGRGAGDGYVQLPVIFLSLKRLLPIGEARNLELTTTILNNEEAKFYEEEYKYILSLTDETISSTQTVNSADKKSIGPVTSFYDAEAMSAGQDNIGQILLAVLSFKRLKDKYPNDYKGGILLIDEIDATLFPSAQGKLLKRLFRYASKFNIQIIFTTHSEKIIYSMLPEHTNVHGKLIFLQNSGDSVQEVPESLLTKDKISAHLNIQPITSKKEKQQLRVYTEDDEAIQFAKFLITKKYTPLLDFINITIGCKELTALCVDRKIPEFNNTLIILDGDNQQLPKPKKAKNIICLPGDKNNYPPDQLFYFFLKALPSNDEFWEFGSYEKQMCFADYPNLDPQNKQEREKFKEWYKSQKPQWGRASSNLFKRWEKDNHELVEEFQANFIAAYNYLAQKNGLTKIGMN